MKQISVLVIVFFFSLSSYGNVCIKSKKKDVKSCMVELVKSGFSGVVYIQKGKQEIYKNAHGFLDKKKKIQNKIDSAFTVGSITKQFTGAAILKLEELGKLKTSDTIDKYFKNIPNDKKTITIHQLLTHSSGIKDFRIGDFDTKAIKKWFLSKVLSNKLVSEPGKKHLYSNSGYSLLAMIIEQTSGLSYEQFLRNEIFLPLNMKSTGYRLAFPKFDNVSIGYDQGKKWGTVLEKNFLADGPYWSLRGNGGIHSTADDMRKWYLALKSEKVLSKSSLKKYFTPWILEEDGGDSYYGYGWVILKTRRGTKLVTHNGGNRIFSADVYHFIDDDVFIYIASNSNQMNAWDVSDALLPLIKMKK
jgi:CubicO group peptidase (beta-lactamase class C family)